ncbi:MAG: histidine phosphatase family protein [Propionibacteriaceae bacterium]|jgi:broad specificity phosphatase PhoE|nr:histidine phosphatase family protein [Propionibacteriaceae bacterium]
MALTTVHLVRHGEVWNPEGVLYGRLPGWHLSPLGRRMAQRVAQFMAAVELTHLRCSPLERAQETMAPIAAGHPGLPVVTDERLTEAGNHFQGQIFGLRNQALLRPTAWRFLVNPLRPSWGEPYRDIAARMGSAVAEARQAAGPGGQALIVSHQLPLWMARRSAEGRPLPHDPRRRQCSLASVTSLTYAGDTLVKIDYHEPAADLLPAKARNKAFSVGR